MGLRDTEEMLEACQADAAQLERTVADQKRTLDAVRALVDRVEATPLQHPPGVFLLADAVRAVLDGTDPETAFP